MNTKICSRCGLEKDTELFYKNKSECKKCSNLRSKQYKQARKAEIQEYNKQYKLENKDEIKIYRNKYYLENKENSSNKQYYNNNKVSVNNKRVIYSTNRRKSDTNFKLRQGVSVTIRVYLCKKGSIKGKNSILQFLPYPIQELKEHLEKQFESWMSWDNRGVYKIEEWQNNDPSTWKWNIDHIIPHSTFNYTSMESQSFKECWSLSNLRPYSAKLNILDNDRGNRNA